MPPTPRWFSRATAQVFWPTPGAKEVGVELHRPAKSFNMTGWRLDSCGNELARRAYGMSRQHGFRAISRRQHAAAYSFDHPEIPKNLRQIFATHDGFGRGPAEVSFAATKPKGSFFLYVKGGQSSHHGDGKRLDLKVPRKFSQWLITEKLLSTVPWTTPGLFALSGYFHSEGPRMSNVSCEKWPRAWATCDSSSK